MIWQTFVAHLTANAALFCHSLQEPELYRYSYLIATTAIDTAGS